MDANSARNAAAQVASALHGSPTASAEGALQSSMATLLVRNDTGVFRLHVGGDAAEVAATLSNGQCFAVLPLFALPRAPEGVAEHVATFVAGLGGAHLGNGWYSCVALDTLASFLVRLCNASDGATLVGNGRPSSSAPCNGSPRQSSAHPSPPSAVCEDVAGDVRPDGPVSNGAPHGAPSGTPPPAQESEDDEEDEQGEEEVWQHVEGCPAAEADKALDVRTALEQTLGKQEARRLLASTRATVAKQNGHKNRILRLGGTALKLRRPLQSFVGPVL